MKRRALFLDRDGVINEDVGYVGTIDRFVFKPEIFDLLRRARDAGYLLVIVTNQSGVGRGMYTDQDHENLMLWMKDQLRQKGIEIDLDLACYTHPEASVENYRRDSFWRKPNAGMLMEAIQRLKIDPARSIMLGDSDRDLEAAYAAGVGRLLLLGANTRVVGATALASMSDVVF